jgi:predicted amidohydrolase
LRRCVQAIAREMRGIVAVVGWPQAAGAVVYNAASVLRDGEIAQTYRKRELPNYAVFDERRYFDVDPDGEPCVFEVEGARVGLVICEDLWFPEPLSRTVDAGAQLVLVPNASPFERDKHAQRDAPARGARRRIRRGAGVPQRGRWAGCGGVRWRFGDRRRRRQRACGRARVRGSPGCRGLRS